MQVDEWFRDHPDEELIRRAATGALPPNERTALDQHLAGCPTCAAEMEAQADLPGFARARRPRRCSR